jgi:hypothetical protein
VGVRKRRIEGGRHGGIRAAALNKLWFTERNHMNNIADEKSKGFAKHYGERQ